MIKIPNMLMIGATGRNVGKTEFACELISEYTKSTEVIGVKITTITEKNGKCPRGGEGCGVCTSLVGNYMVTEETDGPENKDTVRMLNAGANKVLWLRVLRDHLKEGVADLMKSIPKGACTVCESNSARLVIEPAIFIVIKEMGSDEIKDSCKGVIECANKIIDFDEDGWSMSPKNIAFNKNTWSMRSL